MSTAAVAPVMDLAQWVEGTEHQRRDFALRLRRVCHEIGFFQLVNHEIDEDFMRKVTGMTRAIFKLPTEVKQSIAKEKSPQFRGWEALGTERTNGRVDFREQVDTWSDCEPVSEDPEHPDYYQLYGPSQYFSDDVLPGYKALTREWMERCRRTGDILLTAMAAALELPEDHFVNMFGPLDRRMNLTKFIHYPGSKTGQHGVNAHKDTAFVTLLYPQGPGLEIQQQNTGKWLPVETVPGAFVVNLGEMLQSITGQYFVATPHRVRTTRERYACAYFHGAHLDLDLRTQLPLAKHFLDAVSASDFHRNAKFMALKEETDAGVDDMGSSHVPKTFGEQLWNYFTRAYPGIVAKHYGGAAGGGSAADAAGAKRQQVLDVVEGGDARHGSGHAGGRRARL